MHAEIMAPQQHLRRRHQGARGAGELFRRRDALLVAIAQKAAEPALRDADPGPKEADLARAERPPQPAQVKADRHIDALGRGKRGGAVRPDAEQRRRQPVAGKRVGRSVWPIAAKPGQVGIRRQRPDPDPIHGGGPFLKRLQNRC